MSSDVTIKIGATDNASKVLGRVGANVAKLGVSVVKIGVKIAATAAASAAAITAAAAAAAAAMVSSFGKAGDALDKMSKRTGLAVEALSELAFAAEQSGTDLDSLERGIKGMQRAIFDAEMGSTTITDALTEIGLTAADLAGKLPEDQFEILAGRIGELPDASKKAAIALKIFGRAGQELIPLVNEGQQGIAALRKEANELGRTMSTQDAAAAAAYTDQMNRLKSVVIGLKNEIGAGLAPAFTAAAKQMQDLLLRTRETTKGISDALTANDWALAVKIAWAGIKVEFLRGVESIAPGLTIALNDITAQFVEFLSNLLKKHNVAIKEIAKMIINPLKAIDITAAIAELELDPFKDFGKGARTARIEAEAELARLKKSASLKAMIANAKIQMPKAVQPIGKAIGAQLIAGIQSAFKQAPKLLDVARMIGGLKKDAAGAVAQAFGFLFPRGGVAAAGAGVGDRSPLQATQSRIMTGRGVRSAEQENIALNKRQLAVAERQERIMERNDQTIEKLAAKLTPGVKLVEVKK